MYKNDLISKIGQSMNIKKISILLSMIFLSQINVLHAAAGEEKDSDQPASKAHRFNDLMVTSDTSFDESYPDLAGGFTLIGSDFNEFMRARLMGRHAYDIVIHEGGQSSSILNNAILEAERLITTTISNLLKCAFNNAMETGTDLTPDEMDILQYAFDVKDVFEAEILPECFRVNSLNESLFLAALKGNVSIIRILLAIGADVNYVKKPLGSALHIAAHDNDISMVEFLIESGINVNLKDSYGWTAVFWPCSINFKGDDENVRTKIVERMILNGLNLNDKVNKDDQTLLSWAIINQHPNILSALIDRGVDVNFQHLQENSALPGLFIVAACYNNLQIVNLLIQAKVNINAQCDNESTALIYAAKFGYLEIVQRLIAAGANINIQNNKGITALMFAARYGHVEIVQAFIAVGVDVNAQNNTGETALMVAARHGHVEIVKSLITAGADVDLVNHRGENAVSVASEDVLLAYQVALAEQQALQQKNAADATL